MSDLCDTTDPDQVDTSEVKDEKPDLVLCLHFNDMFTSAYELAAHYSSSENALNDDDISAKCEQEIPFERETSIPEDGSLTSGATESRDDGERNKYMCTLCGDSFGYQVPYKKHFAEHYEQTPATVCTVANVNVTC